MSRTRATSILLALVLVAVSFGAGYQYGNRSVHAGAPGGGLQLLQAVAEQIRTRFLDPNVDMRKVYDGGAKGMLEALGDPYTRYMDPTAFRQMQEQFQGTFSGIGIFIDLKDGNLIVVQPIEGTPAFRKGLRAGDRITKIDGRPTKDMALEEAVSRIRGPEGTSVRLVLQRGGQTLEVEITRARIKVVSVQGPTFLTAAERQALRDANVAYIRLLTFGETTAREFKDALAAANRSGARGLVLDLRNNGGGLLDASLHVADEFLESGPIIHTVDRNGKRRTEPATRGVAWTKPMVVLVNEFTASASEIVAGALQDNGLQLVGVRTFGKGVIQAIVNLPGGAGATITTEKYLTPKGRDIHRHGLEPNVVVGQKLEDKTDAEREAIMHQQFVRALEVLQTLMRRSATGRAA